MYAARNRFRQTKHLKEGIIILSYFLFSVSSRCVVRILSMKGILKGGKQRRTMYSGDSRVASDGGPSIRARVGDSSLLDCVSGRGSDLR